MLSWTPRINYSSWTLRTSQKSRVSQSLIPFWSPSASRLSRHHEHYRHRRHGHHSISVYPCHQDLRDITVPGNHWHRRSHGRHSNKTTTDITAVKNITDILVIKNSSYSASGQIRNNYCTSGSTRLPYSTSSILILLNKILPLPCADIRTHLPEQLSSCSPHRTFPISFIPKLENLDFYRSLVSVIFLTKMAWRHCYSLDSRDSSARFFGLVIFHGSTLYGPLISRIKGFYFSFRFSRRYSNISMNPRCRPRPNNLALLSL